MVPKEGWRGRVFEDFEVGDIYDHPLGRTVTTTDNSWFTLLTQNTAPIHFDHHYASKTEFGKPLVDSTFTLALVTGQSVTDNLPERFRQPGLGRGAASRSRFRGGYDLLQLRSVGEERVEVQTERGASSR